MVEQAGRFTVAETPALLPGNDWFTGTPVGPFIDTHLDVPFEKRGRVYISFDTLREMAFSAGLFEGLVPEEQVHKAYHNGYADATKENLGGDLDGIVDALRSAADRLGAVRVDSEAPVEAASTGD